MSILVKHQAILQDSSTLRDSVYLSCVKQRTMKRTSNTCERSDCSRNVKAVQDALDTINGKWKMPIIIVLFEGPMRFNDLQRNIEEITPKVLSKELKNMELNGFITRTVDTGTPVSVTYSLTLYSESLKEVIGSLRNWGLKHHEHLMEQSRSEKTSLLKAV